MAVTYSLPAGSGGFAVLPGWIAENALLGYYSLRFVYMSQSTLNKYVYISARESGFFLVYGSKWPDISSVC